MMQSAHFDSTAYQTALYGSTPSAGFEPSTLKLHSGYPADTDTTCYSNYISSGLQGVQSYHHGCRDPPTYADTTNFLQSNFVPGFGNTNYYKMPNRQMDLVDYTSPSIISRGQDNFLMKSLEPLPAATSQDIFMNNSTPEDHQAHQHHQHLQHDHQQQQQLEHHQQQQQAIHHDQNHILGLQSSQPMYGDQGTNDEDSRRLTQDSSVGNVSMFGQQNVKLESPKVESCQTDYDKSMTSCQTDYDKSMTSSSMNMLPPDSIHSQPQQHFPSDGKVASETNVANNDLAIPQGNTTANLEDTSSVSKYQDTDNKEVIVKSENVSEATSDKDSKSEKKENESNGEEPKPTMSYIALIAKAILESEQRRLNLGSIYSWIELHYPFYKNKGQGWRNSVRHNLSLNDCFIKVGTLSNTLSA